jgi:hypothetical protein
LKRAAPEPLLLPEEAATTFLPLGAATPPYKTKKLKRY